MANASLEAAFDYVIVFLIATVIFFAYIFYAPQSSKIFIDSMFNYFGKVLKIIKFSGFRERIFKAIDDFNCGIRLLFRVKKKSLFLG